MNTINDYGKISVIVPVYNIVKFLSKCVDSILNQTYKNLEIILVDDGSTDGSESLCDEYEKKDKRVIVIHKTNGGQASARNMALDVVSGDYIGFVDSDDWIFEDMFESMVTALVSTHSDMALCGVINDHIFAKKAYKYFNQSVEFNRDELMKEYLGTSHIGCALWNKLYKRELWENIRIPEVRAREDIMVLHFVIGRCNKAVHIGDCKYVQFVRPGSTEQKFSINKLAVIEAQESIMKYVKDNFPQFYPFVELNVARECVALIEEIFSVDKKLYKNSLEKLHNQLIRELELHKDHDLTNDNEYKWLLSVSNNIEILLKNAIKRRLKLKIINRLKKICLLFRTYR